MPMQPQFGTTTLSSFHLWVDNWLTQQGQAYTNHTSQLFYQPDGRLPGYVAYASPFRGWVCDSGVSGAWIPSEISGSFGTLGRGQSGLLFDFENGRVLLPAAFGTGNTVTGSYAFKDFNVYKANERQEDLVFTHKYYLNSRFGNPQTGIPPAYDMVTPCVFVSNTASKNAGFALGGIYDTQMTVAVTVLAENMTQLEGSLSLLTDAKDVNFPQVPVAAWPLDRLGDWKGGSGYNYAAFQAQSDQLGRFVITDVRASKVGDGLKIDPAVYVGVADVTISRVRTLR